MPLVLIGDSFLFTYNCKGALYHLLPVQKRVNSSIKVAILFAGNSSKLADDIHAQVCQVA